MIGEHGGPDLKEALDTLIYGPPKSNPPELSEDERSKLGRSVHTLYDGMPWIERRYSDTGADSYMTRVSIGPERRPISLQIQPSGLVEGSITAMLQEERQDVHRTVTIGISPTGLHILRANYYPSTGAVGFESLNSSPTHQDLLALETVGRFARQDQWGKIIESNA